MKRILTTALFVLMLSLPSAISAQYNLIGKWVETSADSSSFTFHKDGFVSMFFDGEYMDGKGYSIEGLRACNKYTAKFTGKTCKINIYIILTDLDSMVAMVAPGIIEFTDANTIKLALNMEHDVEGDPSAEQLEALRPKDFSNPDNTLVMKRVK
jgi:hypothetical protein